MKTILAIFLICFSATGFASGHAERGPRLEKIYPFKQQAFDLCSGHGLMHLSDEEMRDLCDKLAKNLDDVRALQENPRNDRFLSNLTGLITRSVIPQEVKHDLLRRSYQISKEKSAAGDEWPLTVVQLVERANVLSIDEVSSHENSQNQYLRAIATKYVDENAGKEMKRPERNPRESNSDAKAGVRKPAELVGGSRNETGRLWGYWIAGAAALGMLALLFYYKVTVK